VRGGDHAQGQQAAVGRKAATIEACGKTPAILPLMAPLPNAWTNATLAS
jgi:hypothetical protein